MNEAAHTTILITGATGQIGSYLVDEFRSRAHVIAPGRGELDLGKPREIRSVVRAARPDWILHPAAYTAVDKAESDRENCFAINAEATAVLAAEARQLGIPLLTFSTDYVFNGAAERPYVEVDPTDPINVYGASKLAAEQALAASGAVYINLRTSWVYSARGANFVKTMLRLGGERAELRVVNDQRGCPTSALDAARAVAAILQKSPEFLQEACGTYHLAGAGETTWCGFARHVLAEAKQRRGDSSWASVTPVDSAEFPTPAKRPTNSRLDCTRLREVFGITMPEWQASSRGVVAELLP